MADQWNAGNPTLTNTIAADVPDINENTHWLKDIIQMLAGWKVSTIGTVGPGCVTRRSKFEYASTSSITINPGGYFHDGTTRQWVFWDAALTFTFGAAGSNAASANLGTSQWHYVYIDDTAVITQASPELDADCFVNNTTAPTWSDSKHGWYNGADRCIFVIKTNTSDEIKEFFNDGGDFVHWADNVSFGPYKPSTTWTDVNIATAAPEFCTKVSFVFLSSYIDTGSSVFARVNGQAGTVGTLIGYVSTASIYAVVPLIMNTSTAQVIEVKMYTASANNEITAYVSGWFFPVGM